MPNNAGYAAEDFASSFMRGFDFVDRVHDRRAQAERQRAQDVRQAKQDAMTEQKYGLEVAGLKDAAFDKQIEREKTGIRSAALSKAMSGGTAEDAEALNAQLADIEKRSAHKSSLMTMFEDIENKHARKNPEDLTDADIKEIREKGNALSKKLGVNVFYLARPEAAAELENMAAPFTGGKGDAKLALETGNNLLEPRIKAAVGQKRSDGSVITDATMTGVYPSPDGKKLLVDLGMTADKDGKQIKYDAFVGNKRSADDTHAMEIEPANAVRTLQGAMMLNKALVGSPFGALFLRAGGDYKTLKELRPEKPDIKTLEENGEKVNYEIDADGNRKRISSSPVRTGRGAASAVSEKLAEINRQLKAGKITEEKATDARMAVITGARASGSAKEDPATKRRLDSISKNYEEEHKAWLNSEDKDPKLKPKMPPELLPPGRKKDINDIESDPDAMAVRAARKARTLSKEQATRMLEQMGY